MGSSVMGEPTKVNGDRAPLSLSIDTPPSSSPFPSPSSSFLPPPMPGPHEFAVRLPQGHGQAKRTAPTQNLTQAKGAGGLSNGSSAAVPAKEGEPDSVLSPTTPTPSTVSSSHKHANSNEFPVSPQVSSAGGVASPVVAPSLPPASIIIPTIPSAASSQGPTPLTSSNSTSSTTMPKKPQRLSETSNVAQSLFTNSNPTTPSSPAFHFPSSTTSASGPRKNRDSIMSNASSSSLTSNRPAPPSPAISRRTSGVSGGLGSLSRANSNSRGSANSGKSPEKGGDRNDRNSNRQSLSQLTNLLEGTETRSRLSISSPVTSPIPPTPSTAQPLPSSSVATASTSTSTSSSSSKPAYRPPIKIRDFGYPSIDPRYSGLGVDGKGGGSSGKLKSLAGDVPKQNRIKFLNKALMGNAGYKIWKKEEKARKKAASDALSSPNSKKIARASIGSARSFSSASSASATSEEEDEEEEEEEDDDDGGWAGFKWGMGRLSWHFGNTIPSTSSSGADEVLKSSSSAGASSTGGFPSKSDLDRNFTTEDPSSSSSSSNSSDTENDGQGGGFEEPSPLDYDHADDDEDYYDADEQYGDEDPPLQPGLYRALYAFEPEGIAEMALEEDQIVRVVTRGGGVGWAIVLCDDGVRKQALVPESYLEPVQLDGEEDEAGQN